MNSSAEAVSAVTSPSSLFNVSDSKLDGNPYNLGLTESGSLNSLASPNDEMVPFGFGTSDLSEPSQWLQQLQMVSLGGNEITRGWLFDPTVQVELSNLLNNRSEGGGGFGPFDLYERTALLHHCTETDDETSWNQSLWANP